MKALSIRQPWASLIVGWTDDNGARHDGPKPIENRSRMMGGNLIGERIAIHASKEEDDSVAASIRSARWIFNPGGVDFSEYEAGAYPGSTAELPIGAIVGVATIATVVRSRLELLKWCREMGDDFERFADWYVGEVGIVLRDRTMLAEPVPCAGMLGFWTVQPAIAVCVEAQLR